MSLKRSMTGNCLILSDETGSVLSMNESVEGDCVTIGLDGSLRSDTVHDFLDELTALAVMGVDLRLDFTRTTYVSPACAQALLSVQRKLDERGKGTLTLCKVPQAVLQDFEHTGLNELLFIE